MITNSNGQRFYVEPVSKQAAWIDPILFFPQNSKYVPNGMLKAVDCTEMSEVEFLNFMKN
jgi:hypothetical protein